MQVGLVQCNTIIGDFEANARAVLEGYRRAVAGGADLVLTPELVLSGYPPRDLMFRSRFVEGNLRVLERLASEIGSVPLVAGFIGRNEFGSGKPYTNAAAVIQNTS